MAAGHAISTVLRDARFGDVCLQSGHDADMRQRLPNHVLLFEVWDNAAAVDAQFATDHFKKYQATTANMVAKREIRAFSPVAMNIKGT